MIEPEIKRARFFIDGQNLFHSAKEAFGHKYPNYEVKKLSEKVCELKKWQLTGITFCTGTPDEKVDPYWHAFWKNKLAAMGRVPEIEVFSRKLQYSNASRDDSTPILVGREKGIDIRIALDVTRAAIENLCDVVVIFSQDQDLSEVAEEVRYIARKESRWIKIASAFPVGPASRNKRGINDTDWIKIDRDMYDRCIDERDYRPKAGVK